MNSNRHTTGPFTLKYNGKKYAIKENDLKKNGGGIEELREEFSEIGALVIRYHIGHGNRYCHIDQSTMLDYENNPIHKPALGRDQSNLFHNSLHDSQTRIDTSLLSEFSHYPLGKSKVLNERAQPLIHTNSKNFRGEQALWDIIHSPVWNVGSMLAAQLTKQHFIYICFPADSNKKTYEQLSIQLVDKNQFILSEVNGRQIIKLHSGEELEVAENIQSLKIKLDPENTITPQSNGFVISCNNEDLPMGWFMQKQSKKLVDTNSTENLIRVLRISKGGFYELSKEEQTLIQADLLKNNGFGLFTQNQAFNAMNVILVKLEYEFGFDASTLMSSSLKIAYQRVQSLINNVDISEDFLTGILLTEMVQHLNKTQPTSVRTVPPVRFTNPFKVSLNNAKAIAYAFDLANKEGKPLLKQSSTQEAFSFDPDLLDVSINGQLILPKLDNEKHISAILATAIIVSEQIILEQLTRDTIKYGKNHPNAQALKEIFQNEEAYSRLVQMGSKMPQNENGALLGLQFSYCNEIVEQLRYSLNHKLLIDAAKDLYKQSYNSDSYETISDALTLLFNAGEIFQKLNGISVLNNYSRGINCGLVLVIQKLAPELHNQLTEAGRTQKYCQPLIGLLQPSESEIKEFTENCPYLSSLQNKNKEQKKTWLKSKTLGKSWCLQFTKVAVVSVVIGATSYASSEFIKNNM